MSLDILPVLNPALDLEQVSQAFHRDGRVHIANVLEPASASRLHACLEKETSYLLTAIMPNGLQQVKPEQALTPQQRAQVFELALTVARRSYGALYDALDVTTYGSPFPGASTHYLAEVARFLNSDAFLGFCRRITGLDGIACVDAQATRYSVGHFLTGHDDGKEGKDGEGTRLAAFVLSMTPAWQADFGGVLMFIDERGHVKEGYTPAFNALNLFTVPQLHSVSAVAPIASATARYSIAGWLCAQPETPAL